MERVFFTITGMNYRHGSDFLERGDWVRLEKEPDNKYDKEAIKVVMDGMGHIGYVANSPNTVIGDSFSAGRLYDRIEEKAEGIVRFIVDNSAVCEILPGDKITDDFTEEE